MPLLAPQSPSLRSRVKSGPSDLRERFELREGESRWPGRAHVRQIGKHSGTAAYSRLVGKEGAASLERGAV